MENHFTPKINIFRERNNFYAASQQDGESIADYTARLRNLSTNCNFGDKLEGILIDKFVFGLKSGRIKDRVCEEKPTSETTFSQIVEIAHAKETYLFNEADQVSWIKNKKGQQFRQKYHTTSTEHKHFGSRYAVHGDKGAKNTGVSGVQKHGYFQSKGSNKNSKGNNQAVNTVPENNICRVCGKRHTGIQNCKYKNYRCNLCGTVGHLAKMCNKSKSTNFLNVESVDDGTHESLICNIETNGLTYYFGRKN